MAYLELSDVLARTVFLYDMRLKAGESLGEGKEGNEYGRHRVGEYQYVDRFTNTADGPIVEFRLAGGDGKGSAQT